MRSIVFSILLVAGILTCSGCGSEPSSSVPFQPSAPAPANLTILSAPPDRAAFYRLIRFRGEDALLRSSEPSLRAFDVPHLLVPAQASFEAPLDTTLLTCQALDTNQDLLAIATTRVPPGAGVVQLPPFQAALPHPTSVNVVDFGTTLLLGADVPPLHLTGDLLYGTLQDLSSLAQWSSSNPDVLTVSNDPASRGQVTLHSAGQAAVTGTLSPPGRLLFTGPDGLGSNVKIFTQDKVLQSYFAYPVDYEGGARVAAGDVNGDGVADLITGVGPGAPPQVRVFDGRTQALLRSFLAFSTSELGGVQVAAGDVNADGADDIIVGGGSSQICVYSGSTGEPVANFRAFTSFAGGVGVAAGDFDGDGRDEICATALPNEISMGDATDASPVLAGEGTVKVFDPITGVPTPGPPGSSQASSLVGLSVAAGDVDADGFDEIVLGGGGFVLIESLGAGPDPVSQEVRIEPIETSVGPPGLRVAAADIDGDGADDIVTVPGPGSPPLVRVFSGRDHSQIESFFAYDPTFRGGVFPAATDLTPPPLTATVNVTVVSPTPEPLTFTTLTPDRGPASGGTPVTLTGTGFVPGSTTVTLDGVALGSLTVVDGTTMTGLTPPLSPTGNPSAQLQIVVGGAPAVTQDHAFGYIVRLLDPAPAPGGEFGGGRRTVASAVQLPGDSLASGDVDGDGIEDLVVGDPGQDQPGRPQAGDFHVFFGAAGQQPVPSPATGDFSIVPAGANLGFSLAVGDVDGDGFDDVLAGAPGTDQAFLFRSTGAGRGFVPPVQVPTVNAVPGDQYGFSVAVANFDADPIRELVVGAPDSNILSPFGGLTETFDAPGVLRAAFGGNTGGSTRGVRVLGLDRNNDGFDDLLEASPGDPTSVPGGGSLDSVLSSGAVAGPLFPGPFNTFAPLAPVAGGRFAASLAGGDLDGSSGGDLVVGQPFAGDGRVELLFSDGANGVSSRQVLLPPVVGGSFGRSVTVGDFDGDGLDEPAVAMSDNVFDWIRDQGLRPLPQAIQAGLEFGFLVHADDFNGDGMDDLVVACPPTAGSVGPGQVFIYYQPR